MPQLWSEFNPAWEGTTPGHDEAPKGSNPQTLPSAALYRAGRLAYSEAAGSQAPIAKATLQSKGSAMLYAIGLLLLLIFAYVVITYNRLVKLRVQGDAAWADIDVQLKRRHDLIPNLVETVKGYAAHERTTFERVTEARARAAAASGPAAAARAEDSLNQALRSLFAVAENYPQLRAAGNFLELQNEISRVEDTIQLARRYYNAVVRDLNTRIAQFPSNLVAGLFNFYTREYFEMAAEERQTPDVQFSSTIE
ncbi:MAG: LemA family protein [Terriglobia bacterium]